MLSGCSASAVSMTCSSSGRPASGCNTFGKSEFIRLPWPAASMTTERCMKTPKWRRSLVLFTQALDRSQLCHGPQQFRLRLGDVHLVGSLAHRVLGPLLGGKRRRFVEIARPRRRVGEHGHEIGLHF